MIEAPRLSAAALVVVTPAGDHADGSQSSDQQRDRAPAEHPHSSLLSSLLAGYMPADGRNLLLHTLSTSYAQHPLLARPRGSSRRARRNPRRARACTRSPPARGASGAFSRAASRIVVSDLRIKRETCICDSPTAWAICVCGRPSSKRMRRISRSRGARRSRTEPAWRAARASRTRRPRRRSSRVDRAPRLLWGRPTAISSSRPSRPPSPRAPPRASSSAPRRSRRCSASAARLPVSLLVAAVGDQASWKGAGFGSPNPCRGSGA